MNRLSPIYTESTDCQDCYKCVRHCPVKAIKIENHRATVIAERCIACGVCVDICPTGAKKVRSDLPRAKSLLERNANVIASIAPSYASEWPGLNPQALAGAIKQLGFHAVSETALGAEAVTHALAASLKHAPPGLHISTACPVVVGHIRKYMPQFAPNLTPILSPMQTHAQLLKQHYGPDCRIVFFGPCIAKKCECDEQPGYTDLALTFRDLTQWLAEENIDPAAAQPAAFEPADAARGALYPIIGGMSKTLEDYALPQVELLAASGMDAILQTLENLDPTTLEAPVFLEALACPGGCIGGPQINDRKPILAGELAVRKAVRAKRQEEYPPADAVTFAFTAQPQQDESQDEGLIRQTLQRVGKYKPEDELNCGGCGYESCRHFAQALLSHKAEPDMCLSFLRKQTQKKANALLRCMPSGVVIVDERLHIIECNENFARIAGPDAALAYTARPGMEGADLRKTISIHPLFQRVLDDGQEYRSEALRMNDLLLHVTVFPIEAGKTVGGILLDVTQTENRRELIAQKARAVIEKNMATVQEIACQLGEHMADTEILLRSIAEDYADTPPPEYE
ncbi:[Fe-Fe] hydrogenase large subunit C-terminal domain-containing protein [Pontiella sulfatireligans]|uniref:Iron hydrogenase 1 n=1 Tax=Pontiella sulfatireligans TaxID=2750658 RepID=A0A6C2ULC5_9BACT|nr:[Fe-Fe] hydrogenase large subunit C-terminal domain-containing protein [Pontiella sulfatireligans]VGO20769.1 Iron hydrogenase 1 [Pontiella sulfatireligans]